MLGQSDTPTFPAGFWWVYGRHIKLFTIAVNHKCKLFAIQTMCRPESISFTAFSACAFFCSPFGVRGIDDGRMYLRRESQKITILLSIWQVLLKEFRFYETELNCVCARGKVTITVPY